MDTNQKEIVGALRLIGCTVAITSDVGKGFPDIVVGRVDINGIRKNWLIEIKDGNRPRSAQKLTADQIKFHREWKGQINVVSSAEQAVELVLGMKK